MASSTHSSLATRIISYMKISPKNISYNKREQTMFILKSILTDKRFKIGLVYVDATIQSFKRDIIVNIDEKIPLYVEIDKTAVTIDKRSDVYTP